MAALDLKKYKDEQRIILRAEIELAAATLLDLEAQIRSNGEQGVSLAESLKSTKIRRDRIAKVLQTMDELPDA